nr:hypothetical protein [Chitinophagales bacterium]
SLKQAKLPCQQTSVQGFTWFHYLAKQVKHHLPSSVLLLQNNYFAQTKEKTQHKASTSIFVLTLGHPK